MNDEKPGKLSEGLSPRVFVRPAFICLAQGTLRSRARRQGNHGLLLVTFLGRARKVTRPAGRDRPKSILNIANLNRRVSSRQPTE